MRIRPGFAVLLAIGALSLAACEVEEEAPADDAPAGEAATAPAGTADTAGDGMERETPPPGTYTLVGGEGFGEEGMPEDFVLEVGMADWTATVAGEEYSTGTYRWAGDTLRATHESGPCAGEEILYTWSWEEGRMTLDPAEGTMCEAAADEYVYEIEGGAGAEEGM